MKAVGNEGKSQRNTKKQILEKIKAHRRLGPNGSLLANDLLTEAEKRKLQSYFLVGGTPSTTSVTNKGYTEKVGVSARLGNATTDLM